MECCQPTDGHTVIPKNKLLHDMVLVGQQSRRTEV